MFSSPDALRPNRRCFATACAAWALAPLASLSRLSPAHATTGAQRSAEHSAMPWQPMLAKEAAAHIDPQRYLVSEKLDGVRALWDGRRLWFRSGLPIAAPAAFLSQLPATHLDGELWLGRARFETLVGTVRRTTPDEQAWAGVRYMAFDMPLEPGPFAQRAALLAAWGQRHNSPVWGVVQQRRVATAASLTAWLNQVVAAHGEGLMLHHADASWHSGRSDALLKLKPQADAEAQVLGHVAGQGRHAGRVGALRVRSPAGLEFKLGTGLTDAQRDRPPPVGSWVTYTYRGLTDAGLPRFAAFLRVRDAV